MPTMMNNVESLFTLCIIEMWNFYPQNMKNGPKSLKCIFCIKTLLSIKERYDYVDSSLKSYLNYHFTVTKEQDRYNEFELITFTRKPAANTLNQYSINGFIFPQIFLI